MSADTKPCRHCRQPIEVEARLCQHCHGFQSWWANDRDPRYWIVWPVLILALAAAFFFVMGSKFEPGEDHRAPPHLTVSHTSSRIVPAPDGLRVFVIGRIENGSSQDAANIWFRVNLFDEASHLVDSLLAQNPGLIVPGNGNAMFRVVGPTNAQPAEVKRTEVTIERARVRSKWD